MQTTFATKQITCLEALAKDKALQSASALKLALLKAITAKLIRYLDVMRDVDAVKYADFVVAITQAIDEQNAVIAMRYTLDEKKEGGRRRWHQEERGYGKR